jgi:hypothetical protein
MSWVITPSFTQWTPALISTTLWLDAADAGTITLNGSTVSQWNDKSGNGNHWIQATAASQPTYTQSLINGLDGLSFAASQFMATASTVLQPDTHTMLAVVRPITIASNDYVGSFGATANHAFSMFFTGRNRCHYWNSAGTLVTSDSDAVVLANSVNIAGQSHAPNLQFQNILNGIVKTSAANGSSTTNRIFERGRVSQRGAINLGEVILTTSQLSTDDRQKVEGYLAHKWGLTANLPNDHPFKVNPPAP